MSATVRTYCLDANVLIEAWRKYYSPTFCPDYWKILNELGIRQRIFLPELVYEEITRTEDDLSNWLKGCQIPIRKTSESVIQCLRSIYASNPLHVNLVDNVRGRSLADPWVIAHALNESATVVTKEEKVTAINSTKVKIPNVCDNMDVRWIDDFKFVAELDIRFNCSLG